MILGACYSFQGKSHKTSGTVCQDASCVKEIVGDWTVMAIADGVGSCPKSDIGSKTAVETATSLCVKAFPFDGDEQSILSLMRTAFNYAMREIIRIAKENDEDVAHYDTTLDLVIFNGSNKLYYGHSGDGGIYVLNSSGIYTEITNVQEGEEASSVMPLRSGNAFWEFGVYEDEIAVVASFTDGIRDKLTPPMLRKEKCRIDVPLANKFMFVDVYGMTEEEATDILKKSMKNSAVYLRSENCSITDDITMAIFVNTSVLIKNDPLELYEAPDWANIWHLIIERLYPERDSLKQVGRRRKLERYIVENPEKINVTEEQIEQVLDKYYPLNSEEKKEYDKKYSESVSVKEKVTEIDENEDLSDKIPGATNDTESNSCEQHKTSFCQQIIVKAIDNVQGWLETKRNKVNETQKKSENENMTEQPISDIDELSAQKNAYIYEKAEQIRMQIKKEELDIPIDTEQIPNTDITEQFEDDTVNSSENPLFSSEEQE